MSTETPPKLALVGRMPSCGHVVAMDIADTAKGRAALAERGYAIEAVTFDRARDLLREEGFQHISVCKKRAAKKTEGANA